MAKDYMTQAKDMLEKYPNQVNKAPFISILTPTFVRLEK